MVLGKSAKRPLGGWSWQRKVWGEERTKMMKQEHSLYKVGNTKALSVIELDGERKREVN